jgi:hypothetical protein
LQEIDELFDDRTVQLGPLQPKERRETTAVAVRSVGDHTRAAAGATRKPLCPSLPTTAGTCLADRYP